MKRKYLLLLTVCCSCLLAAFICSGCNNRDSSQKHTDVKNHTSAKETVKPYSDFKYADHFNRSNLSLTDRSMDSIDIDTFKSTFNEFHTALDNDGNEDKGDLDQAVLQGDQVTLSISAYASDDGTLRYAWYRSEDGIYDNAALVSRSKEGNTTCEADTSVPGTYYYFCIVENSLDDNTKTTKSNMIEVVVQEKTVEKTIEINLPNKSGLYEITVYVDGVLQYGPTSVSITDDRSMIVEVTVRGKGTLPVDVYLDGAIYDSQLILFE